MTFTARDMQQARAEGFRLGREVAVESILDAINSGATVEELRALVQSLKAQ